MFYSISFYLLYNKNKISQLFQINNDKWICLINSINNDEMINVFYIYIIRNNVWLIYLLFQIILIKMI